MKRSLGQRFITEMTSHLRAKMVMLVLAGICWLLVRSSQEVEVEFTMPLLVDMGQLPGQVLVTHPPKEVHVRLRGRGGDLLAFALFRKGSYSLRPDAGSGAYAVSAKHLDLDGVEHLAVQSIFPAVIQLRMEELATRRLPIHFQGRVTSTEGYKLTAGPRLDPESVVVMGPRSVVDTLQQIMTERSERLNRKRDLDEDLDLQAPWPTVRLAINTVVLKASIERLEEKRFPRIMLDLRNGGDSILVNPDYLALTVIGGENELESLASRDLEAWIDLNVLPPGTRTSPCRIRVPEGYAWKDPSPAVFRLVRPFTLPDSLNPDSLRLDSLNLQPQDPDEAWRLFP